ncbi:hypothetical protein BX666DRAFT_1989858 [Dichotomocladium elegans]|nr:hypothetical protein BX666DRAFT_1989858 [Dichotomocladium elegans]
MDILSILSLSLSLFLGLVQSPWKICLPSPLSVRFLLLTAFCLCCLPFHLRLHLRSLFLFGMFQQLPCGIGISRNKCVPFTFV